MKKLALVVALGLAFATPAVAAPVPGTISFTGRLSTSGGPVTTTQSVTFHLYSAVTGGSSVWNETQTVTPSAAGLVYVELGAMTTFDQTDFDGSVRFLEITVGSETLSPRLPINSVPYAIRSTDSDNADTVGGMPASSFVTAVTASGGISATGTNTVALSLGACGANQVWKYVSSTWTCSDDVDTNTTYSAAANGLIGISGANAIGLVACATVGHVAKYTATNVWSCAPDANSVYTQGAGIVINGSNVVGIDPTVVPTLAAANAFTGANTFSNASNSFTGVGTGLTGLNAANIASGTLGIARGGTNLNSVGSAGSVVYSTGSAFAFTGQGTSGQVLTSAAAGQPTWTTVTTTGQVDGTQVTGFSSPLTIAATTNLQLASITVPGAPTGTVIFSAHAYLEKSGTTTGRYELSIRSGSCAGTIVGFMFWRPGTTTESFHGETLSFTGMGNAVSSTTFVLCGRKFDSGAPDASVNPRGLNASW